MKKLPKYLSTIGLAMLVWGAFLVPDVFATTIYQQLSDSSQHINANTNNCTNIGSFSVTGTTTVEVGDQGLIVGSINNAGIPNLGLSVHVTSGAVPSNCAGEFAFTEYTSEIFDGAVDTGDLFMTITAQTHVVLPPGTYYIVLHGLVNANSNWQIISNLSMDLFYGYLTANGTGTSIPIAPGIPGFSDTGIATSTLQQNCFANYSATSTLLDNLAQSLTLGFCNVSTFLFVPSQNAVNQISDVPNQFAQRFPFAWYIDIKAILGGLTASTTANYPDYSYNFGTSTVLQPLGSSTVVSIANGASIQSLAPDSTWSFMRTIISYFLWIAFAYFLYYEILRVWHRKV